MLPDFEDPAFDGLTEQERTVIDRLRGALEGDTRIGYALLFGSAARRTSNGASDVDVALGIEAGVKLGTHDLGAVIARLEEAAGRPVDVVLLHEAPPGLAYRIFREGTVILERDRAALIARKARAILEYLDFKPVEEACARGVLAAATRTRRSAGVLRGPRQGGPGAGLSGRRRP